MFFVMLPVKSRALVGEFLVFRPEHLFNERMKTGADAVFDLIVREIRPFQYLKGIPHAVDDVTARIRKRPVKIVKN